jgi:hypothetical protein
MRQKYRRFLSCLLLATYASISLIGDGLHSLLPDSDHHHHHHGIYVVDHICDDACHGDHDRSECAGLTASDEDADSHLCEICSYLFQAISQPAGVAPPIDWQPMVVVVHAKPQPIYSLASLGPQAPRGPPSLLG